MDLKPHAWLIINGEPIEVECGICRDIIYLRDPKLSTEQNEKALREAADRHAKAKHTLTSSVDSMP
jgi:hypothetical protein